MKNATQKTQPIDLNLRILKIGTCPSLSGKSKLTYHIGCDDKSAIHFRVFANTGSGFFSNEWVAADSIGKVLGEGSNITSFTLHSIFKGRSLNNGGFLLAALKQEKLVQQAADTQRCYQLADPGAFMAEMKLLIDSPVDVTAEVKPEKISAGKKAASNTGNKKA